MAEASKIFTPVASGVITAPVARGQNSLSDSTRSWAANIFASRLVVVMSGNKSETAEIQGNGGDSIVTKTAWQQPWPAGSEYVILEYNIADVLSAMLASPANSIEVIKRNDDPLQSVQLSHRLGRPLDDFFDTRGFGYDGIAPSHRVATDAVWLPLGIYVPSGPAGVTCGVSAYSRRVFRYPCLMAYTKLPSAVVGKTWYIGFEAGSQTGVGQILLASGGTASISIVVGQRGSIASVRVDALLPADWDTAEHVYYFKVNKQNAEFFVDGVLTAIVLFGVADPIPVITNEHPYAISSCLSDVAVSLTSLVEIYMSGAAGGGGNVTFPIQISTANNFVISDGDPCPPRQYPLYNWKTSTGWKDQAIAAGSITSHPVPVWGYKNKTLMLQAGGGGSLDVQLYAGGGWRTADTLVIAANTLEYASFDMETPVLRFVFTPDQYPTTVTAAEVCIS
jgi:hypothetical protein